MNVKIGFSLGLGGERPPVIPTHDRASDFKSRLGPLIQQPAQLDAEALGGRQGTDIFATNTEAHDRHLLVSDAKNSTQTLAELYELGLRAGGSLSHLTTLFGRFQNDVETLDVEKALPVSPPVNLNESVLMPVQESRSQFKPQAFGDMVNRLTVEWRKGPVSSDELQRETSTFFAARLPEKRWQLVSNQESLSLLIRDYFMTEDERSSLLADLLSRLAVLGMEPTNIWVNGHSLVPAGHELEGVRNGN